MELMEKLAERRIKIEASNDGSTPGEETLKTPAILVKQNQLVVLEMKIHNLLQLVKNIIRY